MIGKALITTCVAFAGAMALLLPAAAASAAIIDASTRNGSFESGTGNSPALWQAAPGFTAAPQRLSTLTASDGTYSGLLGVDGTSAPDTLAIDSAYAVHTGDVYSLKFDLRGAFQAQSNATINWKLFYTSDNTLSGTATSLGSGSATLADITGTYYSFSYQTAAAAVAANGKELFLAFTDGANISTNQFLRIDNVRLSVTPEPAALSIAGLALAGLTRRKRRCSK